MSTDRKPGGYGTAALVALVLLAGGSVWGYLYWRKERIKRNELNATAALKVIVMAETDFRSNDRDENRVNDFWTGDVAGLYFLVPLRGAPTPIKLIERALAEADPTRPGARPFQGYWFRAMDTDDVGDPYRTDTGGDGSTGAKDRNCSKFGFCAYPADYPRSGRWTYIVNEGNTILKRDSGGKPILRFPRDPNLKEDYTGGHE